MLPEIIFQIRFLDQIPNLWFASGGVKNAKEVEKCLWQSRSGKAIGRGDFEGDALLEN